LTLVNELDHVVIDSLPSFRLSILLFLTATVFEGSTRALNCHSKEDVRLCNLEGQV
jgi:hypothetical protein